MARTLVKMIRRWRRPSSLSLAQQIALAALKEGGDKGALYAFLRAAFGNDEAAEKGLREIGAEPHPTIKENWRL